MPSKLHLSYPAPVRARGYFPLGRACLSLLNTWHCGNAERFGLQLSCELRGKRLSEPDLPDSQLGVRESYFSRKAEPRATIVASSHPGA